MIKSFRDGIVSFTNQFINSRNPVVTNSFFSPKIIESELREIYRTGLGNKIVSIKSADPLNDTLQFDTKEDEEIYRKKISHDVVEAAQYMVAFGRGILVIHKPGEKLEDPISKDLNRDNAIVRAFSGDEITASDINMNFSSPRYYKPNLYIVRGNRIHYTRVVDFTYIKPVLLDAPLYRYGGISEFQIIYQQLINDAVMQRAIPTITEKASNLFYKMKGFNDALSTGNEDFIVQYMSKVEDLRSMSGATVIDSEDEVMTVNQSFTNLAESDLITLKRISMVTGISIMKLVGTSGTGGLVSSDKEERIDQSTIELIQNKYLIRPLNELMRILKMGEVQFKETQQSPERRIEFETKTIANAKVLWELGEDHEKYLEDKGILTVDKTAEFLSFDEEKDTIGN